MKRSVSNVCTVLVFAAGVGLSTSAAPDANRPSSADGTAITKRLHDLFEREWQWRLKENPEFATSVAVHDDDDKLSDVSLANLARQTRDTQAFLAELKAVDRERLSGDDQVNYDIFETQLQERVESHGFGEQFLTINADSGFHSGFAQIWQAMPFETVKNYENYLARLRAFPRYMDQNIALMREGVRRGITVPKATLAGVEESVKTLAADDPEKSPLWTPFGRIPQKLPAAAGDRLRAEGRRAIREAVVPAYAKFFDFMTREYIPGCRETLAGTALPNGEAYYKFLIRQYTTLDLTAGQIHQIGLDDVKSIRMEMEKVISDVGFQGDFAAFLKFLRTDPRFYPKTAEELLMRASFIAKRMDGKLPSLFKTLPRQPYTVAPVPDYLAPKYTAGRYNGAPKGSRQPGEYRINTYALETRALFNLEALTFHEAVPGHHLQIALAEEAAGVPNFRKYSYISAFGEGWGLYSEWLGLEAGFYTDPYSNFGRLTYAMWRACRLVVDTGVHARGWTRQQVLDHLAANTALSLHEIRTETDRYISWPGQALSYRIGYLKLRELRTRAEKELGGHFDVRLFHDAVLKNGSVPLPALERQVERFIADQKNAEKDGAQRR
ncbi:MAG: DUF885 domain-containing protein [Verrucomicrobia bacterium]|nr:DUF885 domain-containing protein [Verrucomicrobiota bacterium]